MIEFYHKDDISDLLRCKNCRNTYVKPLILPCFEKICSKCVDCLSINNKFRCCFCNIEHEIPPEGFKLDNDLMQLDEQIKHLQMVGETIEKKEKALENDLYEYCRSIKNKIDLCVEEMIEKINQIRTSYFEIIDNYLKDSRENINEKRSAIVCYTNNLNTFITYIKQFVELKNIGDEESKQKLQSTRLKTIEAEELVSQLDSVIFNDQKLDFKRSNDEIDQKYVGEIIFSKNIVEFPFDLNNKGKRSERISNETKIKKVISASWDRTLKVWNVDNGQCIRSLEGHSDRVICVSIIDESKVVSGSWDGSLKVWNIDNGECVQTIRAHSHYIECLTVVNKSKILSGSWDKTLKVWNIHTGQCIQILQGHSGDIYCVQLIDSTKVVSGSLDRTLKLWNVETGECINTLRGHSGAIYCLSMIDKSKIVSGSYDNTLKVWNVESGECIRSLLGHSAAIYCVSMIDNLNMVSGSGDRTLKLWNVQTGECVKTLKGQDGSNDCVSVIDKSTIVSGSGDGTLNVWNIETGQRIKTIYAHSDDIRCLLTVD